MERDLRVGAGLDGVIGTAVAPGEFSDEVLRGEERDVEGILLHASKESGEGEAVAFMERWHLAFEEEADFDAVSGNF